MLVAVLTRFMETLDTDPVPGSGGTTLRRDGVHPSGVLRASAHDDIDLDPNISCGFGGHTEKIVSLHLDQGMPEPVLTSVGHGGPFYRVQRKRDRQKRQLADEAAGGATPVWQRIVDSAYSEESFANGVEMIIMGVRGGGTRPVPVAYPEIMPRPGRSRGAGRMLRAGGGAQLMRNALLGVRA
ncbi:MAG: hypothetical protein ACLTMP_14560 [Eggerthella lenta]